MGIIERTERLDRQGSAKLRGLSSQWSTGYRNSRTKGGENAAIDAGASLACGSACPYSHSVSIPAVFFATRRRRDCCSVRPLPVRRVQYIIFMRKAPGLVHADLLRSAGEHGCTSLDERRAPTTRGRQHEFHHFFKTGATSGSLL